MAGILSCARGARGPFCSGQGGGPAQSYCSRQAKAFWRPSPCNHLGAGFAGPLWRTARRVNPVDNLWANTTFPNDLEGFGLERRRQQQG